MNRLNWLHHWREVRKAWRRADMPSKTFLDSHSAAWFVLSIREGF